MLPKSKTVQFFDAAWRLGVCSCCGIIFGIAMEKGRVFEPAVIRSQMEMQKFIMLKMFMSAVASGIASMLALQLVPITRARFNQARNEYVSVFGTDKGVLSSALGAAILGSGMTLAGACPGMVLIQVGAGVPRSLLTFLGCICGALLYGWFSFDAIRLTKPQRPFRSATLDTYFSVPYYVIAVPLCAALAGFVLVLEMFAPWKTELPAALAANVGSGGSSFMSRAAWPPYVAGAMIGVLQVPVILSIGDTLGGSSSYCTMVANLITPAAACLQRRLPPYLAKYRRVCLDNWWQVVYVTSAIAGGAISAHMARSTITHQVVGVSPLQALPGGVLMVFGARLAAGCTSGHGLSGMAVLSLHSFIAVPCMFASAIATAWLMG